MTGAVQWVRQASNANGYYENLARVVVTANAVYAAGSDQQDFVYREMLLRVYSPSGAVLAEERAHRVSGMASSQHMALAVDGQRLFTAGYVTNATVDALVRSYDVSSIETAPEFSIDPPSLWSRPIPITVLMRMIR